MPVLPVTRPYETFAQAAKIFIDSGIIIVQAKFALDAVRSSAAWVTPVKLREQVCRDRDDDKFIEAALAAGARTLIARDADLTILRKPFGIEVLTPRQWLSKLPRAQRRQLR